MRARSAGDSFRRRASIISGMPLHPARPSDAAAVAALATQLGYPSRPEEAERRLQALAERSDQVVLVAETDDGAVVAWCHVGGKLSVESEHKPRWERLAPKNKDPKDLKDCKDDRDNSL
jgi:hypothetical protein